MTARSTASSAHAHARALGVTGVLLSAAVLAGPAHAVETVEPTTAPWPSLETTPEPVEDPITSPVEEPTEPADDPSEDPSPSPSDDPSIGPTTDPSPSPTDPSEEPSPDPSDDPTPSDEPSPSPSDDPTEGPSPSPSDDPTEDPSPSPSDDPTEDPTPSPSDDPTGSPTPSPSPSDTPWSPSPSSPAPSTPWTPHSSSAPGSTWSPSPTAPGTWTPAPSSEAPGTWSPSPSEDGRDDSWAPTPGTGSDDTPTPETPGAPGDGAVPPSGEPLDLDMYPVPGTGPATEAQGAPSLGSNNGSGRSALRDASDSALSGLQNSGRLLEDDAFAALEHAQKEKLQKPQASAGGQTEDLRSILTDGESDGDSMAWAEPGPLLARVGQAPAWLIGLLLVSVATLGALGYRFFAGFQRRREERQGG